MFVMTDQEFDTLTAFVKVNYGLDLSNKKTFVQMRVQKLMKESSFEHFSAYFEHVCGDMSGVAVSNFINGLTVNYTLFNRESFHFDFVAEKVLPELYIQEQASKDLRIWSAGCSTGEEPYTLAIILADFLGGYRAEWDTKILATDISTFALEKAIVGAYPAASVEGLDPQWVAKYFVRDPEDPDKVCIAPSIREEVIYRKQNLVKDPFIFKQKFHFIFCRNVMIYFDEPTRQNLIRKFYNTLGDGGYLFIGMSETIDTQHTGFEHVLPSVYRKPQRGIC